MEVVLSLAHSHELLMRQRPLTLSLHLLQLVLTSTTAILHHTSRIISNLSVLRARIRTVNGLSLVSGNDAGHTSESIATDTTRKRRSIH